MGHMWRKYQFNTTQKFRTSAKELHWMSLMFGWILGHCRPMVASSRCQPNFSPSRSYNRLLIVVVHF